MGRYIIRRLLLIPIILFGATLLIFGFIQFLSPVERASLWVKDVPNSRDLWESAIKQYCLDCPLPVQYWNWLVGRKDPVSGEIRGGILRGDLGYSQTGKEYVIEMIKRRFPATVELALWAAIPVIGVGIWLWVQAAVNHNKPIDQMARIFSIIGWSFPTFVFGLLVLMFFYAKLGWFMPGRLSDWAMRDVVSPVFVQYTHLMTIDALINGRFDIFIDAIRHLVLPIFTLAYIDWALLLRVTRSSMLETLRQDYVTTARAKGLPEKEVINTHARPNALIPVATTAGFSVILLLNGVVITETVFNYPGIGSAVAEAAVQLDVVTSLGFILLNGLILILANLAVDVLYVFIDPRVTLE